jgi:hypothetical protein
VRLQQLERVPEVRIFVLVTGNEIVGDQERYETAVLTGLHRTFESQSSPASTSPETTLVRSYYDLLDNDILLARELGRRRVIFLPYPHAASVAAVIAATEAGSIQNSGELDRVVFALLQNDKVLAKIVGSRHVNINGSARTPSDLLSNDLLLEAAIESLWRTGATWARSRSAPSAPSPSSAVAVLPPKSPVKSPTSTRFRAVWDEAKKVGGDDG